jgi:hypothetical protein
MKTKTGIMCPIVVFALAIAVAPLSAGSLKDLFTAATQSNQDYSVYTLDLELAQLKKTRRNRSQGRIGQAERPKFYVSALASYAARYWISTTR